MKIKLAHHAMTWEGWARDQDQPLDPRDMLAQIAEAGYLGVELSPGLFTNDAVSARAALADACLELAAVATAVAAVPYPSSAEEFRNAVDTAARLGVSTIMLCGGFLGSKRRINFESDYEQFAEVLRDCCDAAEAQRITVAFHPHLGCLIETVEQTRTLLELGLADRDNFALCMDTGHLAAAHSAPIDFIRAFGAKIQHVHLKDWHEQPGAGHFVELGSGNVGLDFAAIVSELEKVGYDDWYVVETDRCTSTPAESARQSREHLEAVYVTA